MSQTYDGATTALHRRIEELTEELERWKATTWQTPEQAMGCIASWKAEEESWAEEFAQLRKELAAARAAREQAETDRELLRGAAKTFEKACAQTERERDTALEHFDSARKQLTEWRRVFDCERPSEALALYETAKRERDTLQAQVKELEEYISRAPSGNEQRLIREAEGAVTLEKARHEETRAALSYAQGKREAAETALADANERLDTLRQDYAAVEADRDAANTALASARELPALWRAQANQYPKNTEGAYGAAGVRCCANELEAALTSHPAPVAAPCAGCAELRAQVERLDLGHQRRRIRRLIQQKYRMLAERAKLSKRLRVKREEARIWQAQRYLADVKEVSERRLVKKVQALETEVENLKFRLKMAKDSNPDSVLSKHNAMLMAVRNADHYKAEWEACHRQHEQCMKLLEMAQPWVVATPVGKLIREMLTLGELKADVEIYEPR